jgi:autotransporter-associated beta strand protein
MTINALNRWLKPFSASNRDSRRRRRPRPAFRPGGEPLEQRLALSVAMWSGDGTDPNWTDENNWFGGDAPKPGDDLVFPASVHQMTNVNDFPVGTSFHSIEFKGAPYNISGNEITISAGGGISVTAAGATKFNVPIVMTKGMTVSTVASSSLNLGGSIGGSGGTLGLQKSGPGALVLSGSTPNGFTQGVTVSQGTLQLAKAAGVVAVPTSLNIRTESGSTPIVKGMNNEQIGTSATVTVQQGCTLDLTSSTQSISALNVTGGKVIGTDKAKLILLGSTRLAKGSAGQVPSLTVALALGAGAHDFIISNDTTLTLNGAISGDTATQLTLSGGGTLKLAGTTANTYAGTTVVTAGTLILSKSGSKPEDKVAVPGPLIIGSATRLPSVVRLEGADQIKPTATVTVSATGLLDLNRFSAQVGSLKMTGGTVSNGTLALGGDVEATSVAGPQQDSPSEPATISAALQLGAATRTFDVTAGPGDVGLKITGPISGTGDAGLIKDGAGTLQFAGSSANTYKGTTSVIAGRLQLNKSGSDNQSIPAALTIGSDAQDAPTASVQLLDNNEINDGAAITVTDKGLLDLNNHSDYVGALTLHGGQVKTGTGVLSLNATLTADSNDDHQPSRITGNLNLGPKEGTYSRVFNIDNSASDLGLIINGVISGQKNATLYKTGVGALQLAGSTSNTFEGTTRVKEGVLELNKDAAKAIVGGLTIDAVSAQSPGKVILMGNQQIAGTSNVTIERFGVFDLNNRTETIDSLVIASGLATTGQTGVLNVKRVTGVPINGPGKLTGRVNLNGGSVTFAAQSVQSAGVGLIADVDFLGSGTLEKAGAGVVAVTGTGGRPGLINVRDGVLQISGAYNATDVHVYGGAFEGSGTTRSIATGSQEKMQVRVGTPTTFAVLQATNGVNLTASATLQVKIQGASNPEAGVNFDQLKSATGVNVNGATLSIDATGFKFPPKGTRYRIIDITNGAPLGGKFANLPAEGSIMKVAVPGTNRTVVFSIDYGVHPRTNYVDMVYEGELV